ncbi:hypothetical protein B0A52_09613 [Exophiala mesophila]|uniref:FAM192A/Fyv6 N-terminal domain-containing protein n=1 Tax=Exophiala mesophila TaxID=212818 RepID=A0A438MT43_EXOME|nr:hypothetical protein B0A52_09613 [Exophiala mesophila]
MSRFVSAGTEADSITRDDAWIQAQKEVEAQRQTKPVVKPGEQEGGKSLYEVLQQNKASKQEAFEEQARLKNQFRALDDDEIEFLESVNESVKAKQHAVEQETAEQLEEFRKQRAAAEHSLLETAPGSNPTLGSPVASSWMVKKKKRRRDHDGPPERATDSKSRKLSSTLEDHPAAPTLASPPPETSSKELTGASSWVDKSVKSPASASAATTAMKQDTSLTASNQLGLQGYSSDED